MTRSPRFPVIVLAVLAAAAVAVIAVVTTAVLSTERDDRLAAPFAIGETWYACDGVAGPALVLVAEADGDCAASAARAPGATLHAPADARVASIDGEALCLDLATGGSVRLAPVSTPLAPGDAVGARDELGTLLGARLEWGAWSGDACAGDSVPFDTAHGMRMLCADDAPDVVTACPTGDLGGVDLQAACDAQYPGEERELVLVDAASAYSWRCEAPDGASDGIEVIDECVREHGLDAYGVAMDARDPYSWICVR